MTVIDMKFFMKESLLEDEIIEVPGVAPFVDLDGEIIPFKIKVLGMKELNEYRKMYTKTGIVYNEEGKRILDRMGQPVLNTEIDEVKAMNRTIVESLIFPNLKDPELMKFYGVVDVLDMPFKLFKNNKNGKNYDYVLNTISELMGVETGGESKKDIDLVEEAKN